MPACHVCTIAPLSTPGELNEQVVDRGRTEPRPDAGPCRRHRRRPVQPGARPGPEGRRGRQGLRLQDPPRGRCLARRPAAGRHTRHPGLPGPAAGRGREKVGRLLRRRLLAAAGRSDRRTGHCRADAVGPSRRPRARLGGPRGSWPAAARCAVRRRLCRGGLGAGPAVDDLCRLHPRAELRHVDPDLPGLVRRAAVDAGHQRADLRAGRGGAVCGDPPGRPTLVDLGHRAGHRLHGAADRTDTGLHRAAVQHLQAAGRWPGQGRRAADGPCQRRAGGQRLRGRRLAPDHPRQCQRLGPVRHRRGAPERQPAAPHQPARDPRGDGP
mmetsp:Transcript_6193/g.24986  ORF Transcript_6193/g.24986 Transcript_6193/m.24986 type:complete len:325 (+) Transcript_6193:1528-2502(+)